MVQGKRSPNRKLTRDQWDALQPLICRSPAGPKVVPADDPRPTLQRNPADDFDDDFETQPANDENADFF